MKLTSGSKLNDQIWSAYNPEDQVKAIKSTDMRYAGILKENREDWSETKLVRENFAKGQEEIYEQQYAFGKKDLNESYIIEDELASLLPQYQPKRVVKEQFLNGNFGMRQGGNAILNENLNEGIQDMDDYGQFIEDEGSEEAYGNSIDPEDGLSYRDYIKPDVEEEIKDAIDNASQTLADYGVYGEPNYEAVIRILMSGEGKLDDVARDAAEEALAGHTTQNGGEFKDIGDYIDALGQDLAEIIDNNTVNEASKGSKPDYIDLDKDGNKKEPMKKAAEDAKKTKKLNESYDPMKLYFDQDYRFKA